MTNELKNEWISVINYSDIFIYGAKKTAEGLYDFISSMGYRDHVKGFLVSDGANNDPQLCGLSVYDIHEFDQKAGRVLVPHVGVYRKQISSLLSSLGFSNVFFVSTLMERIQLEKIDNMHWEHEKAGWETYDEKSEYEKQRDTSVREKIMNILQEGRPDFGGIKPYQSMELIGLKGVRPTEYRIREYGLRDILNSQHDVLDIGCNSGFLDITISNLVHSLTGIEYDESLIKAANLAKDYLGVSNCSFYHGDFNDWYKNTNAKYSVIFSFAIHHWLNLTSKEYTAMLNKLLVSHGYLCFESHIYDADPEFYECCKELEDLNYKVICKKRIKDDGLHEREFVLFQKM